MNVNGYEIDVKNTSFKQEIQVVIKYHRERKENEVFIHDMFFDNLSLVCSNEESRVSNVPHRGLDCTSYWRMSDKRIDVRYDEVANCIVFMLLDIIQKDNINEPTYLPYVEMQRFYVTPEKNIIYNNKQKSYYYSEEERKEAMENPEWVFLKEVQRIGDFPFNIQDFDFLNETPANDNYEKTASILLETMGKVFNKSVMIAGNRSLTLNSKSSVMEFLLYKEPKVRSGPLQRKINELCSVETKPFVPVVVEQTAEFIQEGRLIKINDDVSCFQMFRVNKDRKEFYETFRIFIESDGNIISCKKNNFNEFVPTKFSMQGAHWKAVIRDNEYDKEATTNNKLAYYKDIIMNIPCEGRGYAIWCFLTDDCFEKLYKAGFQNYLNALFLYGPDYPEGYIGTQFNLNDKLSSKSSINQILGLNKYQIKRTMELYERLSYIEIVRGYGSSLIYKLKKIIGSTDINFLDNKTFDFLFDYFIENYDSSNIEHALNYAIDYSNTYGLDGLINHIDVIKVVINARGYSVPRYYTDTLKMIRDMEAQTTYKLKISNEEELTILHDNITSLYNLKKNEYKVKAFKERIPVWEEYCFSDENYSIIAPQTPDDMVKEGNKLHHCVKSYIDRVTNGATNILFLRKAEELDEPFFTIELSNDKKIEQVHGLQNRNMSTEPGIEDFVKKWAKKKRLSLNNCNKVR